MRWKIPIISIIRMPRISPRRPAWSRRRWATSPMPKYTYAAPPVFLFEPHQPEMCNFKPQVILNIDEVWEHQAQDVRDSRGAKASVGLLRARRVAAGHAGRTQFRQGHDLWRGLSAAVPDGDGGIGMKTVVVRNIKRTDAGSGQAARRARRRHRARGLWPHRTDEALSAPGLGGRRGGGHRGDRAGASRRQLDDPCRGRAVQARRHPGGRLQRRQYRRHVRRSARDLADGARRHRPRHRCRRARCEVAARNGLSGVVEGDLRQGHGQGDARRGQRAGGLRRHQRHAGRCRDRR